MAFAFKLAYTGIYGLTLHYHSGKTSERIIINPAVLVLRVIAKIMNMNIHQPFLLCAGKYRHVYKALEHLGQNGYYVYSH